MPGEMGRYRYEPLHHVDLLRSDSIVCFVAGGFAAGSFAAMLILCSDSFAQTEHVLTTRTIASQTQHENSAISKINYDMGRKKDPARGNILKVLESGAHTLRQIAIETGHSTRTVQSHLKELVESEQVIRLNLGGRRGYPKNTHRVFYQLNLLAGPKEPIPELSRLVHEKGRLRAKPILRKGLTPLGKKLLNEGALRDRRRPRYLIKRPWSQEREGRQRPTR